MKSFILICAFICSVSFVSADAAMINIEPLNYGTIWYGAGPYAPMLTYTEATNNDAVNGSQPYMGGISLNDYGYSRAIVTFDTMSLSQNPNDLYYLDLNATSVWAGIPTTTLVSLSFFHNNGLVTASDYDKGTFAGNFNLANNGTGIGDSKLDVTQFVLVAAAANLPSFGINIRTANDFLSGILFSQPKLILSSEQLSTVPLPPSVLLFGSGLLCLVVLGRRKNAHLSSGLQL